MVVFDSSSDSTYLVLTTTDDYGKCSTQQSVRVTVIPHPTAYSYSKQDVCVGDTVTLAISTQSPDAYKFNWYVDYTTPIANSPAMAIIASNSNSGGPFSITWLDTGTHVIQLNTFTEQGCTSKPTFDTVNVHAVPDASFKITNIGNSLCIEDSVLFSANTINYNLAYAWAPAHSFTNINEPSAWGRVELAQSIITLKVTDPFGCAASASLELDPGTCCTVAFPNAFTPNGDGQNDFFRPLFSGYHRFHEFRILNRWGQTVFESANSSLQWDGNYNGVPQDIGVYFYYIKYDCGGKTIEESGDVTLIR
jgi:gliding motility-associated-like protein